MAGPDRTAAIAALAAARRNDWVEAYAQAGAVHDPLALKMVRWLDYTRNTPGGRFAEISDFIIHNPGWPYQKTLTRNAEAALATESDDTAATWFKNHPPISAAGKVRQAEMMIKAGKGPTWGPRMLRAAWTDEDFLPGDERNFWAKYATDDAPRGQRRRLDRLLWDGHPTRRAADDPAGPGGVPGRGPGGARARGQCPRRRRHGRQGAAEPAAQPRPRLRRGALAAQAGHERRRGAALLLAHPDDPVRPTSWWSERQIVTRRLLAAGNADLAYKIAQQHGLSDGGAYSEAEFLAGYIALRYFKKPDLAFDHFSHILARVAAPYAKSRAAYWSGRAAEAEGKHDLALKWYAAGAENMTTFYGQLSAHQLGHDAPPRPVPEPKPTADAQARISTPTSWSAPPRSSPMPATASAPASS